MLDWSDFLKKILILKCVRENALSIYTYVVDKQSYILIVISKCTE